jgi:NAD(P)-dependent dehydrogenase (short-subunit alcohol dehydrogenase family)
MSSSDLQGKKVIVVGGTAGIGFAVAKATRDAGANVVVGSSNATNVAAAVDRLGNSAEGSAVDVTSEADVAAFFERVGRFDHLVYTAGDWARPSNPWDLEAAGGVLSVRFWGALRAIKYARATISQDGSITLTNGAVAHRPRKGAPLSTAMAGAIEHLTRALAVELAPIRVNAVCPGVVLTDVWKNLPEGQLERMTSRQPLPRGGTPREVAEAYLYLMRGGFTTGDVLRVDGGYTLI